MLSKQTDSANLDYLRSWAVLCVLLDHLAGTSGITLGWLQTLGRVGVLIFFVHTALVLMFSLERSYPVRGWVTAFYVRRAFRVYPLVFACTLAAVVFGIPGWPFSHPLSVSPWMFLVNVLLVQNITLSPSILLVSWSLPYEIQMYLVLPCLFWMVKRSSKPWLVVTLCLLPALVLPRVLDFAHFARISSLVQFVPCFLAGILAFALPGKRSIPAVVWIVGLPLFLLLASLLAGAEMRKGIQYGLCLLLGSVIPFLKEIGNPWLKRAAHLIAKYSYGIYLSHLPAIWLALHLSRLWQRYCATAVLLVALPVLLFHLIEDPMIRYGKVLTMVRGQGSQSYQAQ